MAEVLKVSNKEINDLANVVIYHKIKESIHKRINFVFNIKQTEL